MAVASGLVPQRVYGFAVPSVLFAGQFPAFGADGKRHRNRRRRQLCRLVSNRLPGRQPVGIVSVRPHQAQAVVQSRLKPDDAGRHLGLVADAGRHRPAVDSLGRCGHFGLLRVRFNAFRTPFVRQPYRRSPLRHGANRRLFHCCRRSARHGPALRCFRFVVGIIIRFKRADACRMRVGMVCRPSQHHPLKES